MEQPETSSVRVRIEATEAPLRSAMARAIGLVRTHKKTTAFTRVEEDMERLPDAFHVSYRAPR